MVPCCCHPPKRRCSAYRDLTPRTAFAGGDLFYDEAKAFYAAVHGGKVAKGSLVDLVNPFGEWQVHWQWLRLGRRCVRLQLPSAAWGAVLVCHAAVRWRAQRASLQGRRRSSRR